MSRGDRQEDIYLDDVDRQDFLKTLAEASQKTGWQAHAYCLMRNHYHLANLVAGTTWLARLEQRMRTDPQLREQLASVQLRLSK